MSKSIYSEEELNQLFQNLYNEKKKVQDLEKKYQNLADAYTQYQSENKSQVLKSKDVESEEIEKLKEMVALYKKKSTQAIQAMYENEQTKNKQEASLAQQIKDSNLALEDLKEENLMLLEQQKKLKKQFELLKQEHNQSKKNTISNPELDEANLSKLDELKSQNRRLKDQVDKFAYAVKEKEKKIQDLQQYELQFKKTNERRSSLEASLELELNSNKALRAENQNYLKSLSDHKKHTDQTERAIQHLRERSEEAVLELNQLREEHRRTEAAASNYADQLKESQSKLNETMDHLTLVQAEKNESQEELDQLSFQFQQLKKNISEAQEKVKQLENEKAEQITLLSEKNQLMDVLEKEVALIKEGLLKGIAESQEIEIQYMDMTNEKVALQNQVQQSQLSYEQSAKDYQLLLKQQEELLKNESQNKLLIEHLQEKHQNTLIEHRARIHEFEQTIQRYQDSLRQKEIQVEELNNHVSHLTQEKYKADEASTNALRMQEDQEARIKIAQQHLGKKVKEAALMSEKINEQRMTITDLYNSFEQQKSVLAEMQENFDKEISKQKKIEEDFNQVLVEKDNLIARAEEKYFKATEKLAAFEEKQKQMQSIFASLGGFFSNQTEPISQSHSFPKTNPSPVLSNIPVYKEEPQSQVVEEIFLPKQSSFNQSSLFDFEQPHTQIKQTFFD